MPSSTMSYPPMSYPRNLAGKVGLIVGGEGAIGAITGRMMADAGMHVVITHLPGHGFAERAAAVLSTFSGSGHLAVAADVTDTASLVAVRQRIADMHGRLDMVVNAAGFTKAVPHADLDALDDTLIDRIFTVNWRGQFAAARVFAPLLQQTGDGLLVFISSIAAFTGIGSNIAYCAAKAGIDVMIRSLARVLAPDVRVLGVSPGVVDTAFVPGRSATDNEKIAASTPLKRVGRADDVAAAIMACATHLGFSTGHIIQVDGGRAL